VCGVRSEPSFHSAKESAAFSSQLGQSVGPKHRSVGYGLVCSGVIVLRGITGVSALGKELLCLLCIKNLKELIETDLSMMIIHLVGNITYRLKSFKGVQKYILDFGK
jgi:hypothetical protein